MERIQVSSEDSKAFKNAVEFSRIKNNLEEFIRIQLIELISDEFKELTKIIFNSVEVTWM